MAGPIRGNTPLAPVVIKPQPAATQAAPPPPPPVVTPPVDKGLLALQQVVSTVSTFVNTATRTAAPQQDARAGTTPGFSVGSLLMGGAQALQQLARMLPTTRAPGATDPLSQGLTQPIASVREELKLELARKPPNPQVLAFLITTGQQALAESSGTLSNVPSDLAGAPAAALAAEAGALAGVMAQAQALLPPGPHRAQAGQAVLEAQAVQAQSEALVAMSAYVNAPSEKGFDTYVREFAEAQLASQRSDLNRAALQLPNATPEQWGALAVAAAELQALMGILQQPDPFLTLTTEMQALNTQCQGVERDWKAAPAGMTGQPAALGPQLSRLTNGAITGLPVSAEALLALPVSQRQAVVDAMSQYSGRGAVSPAPAFGTTEAGQRLTQALSTAGELRASGLTFQAYQDQASARVSALYQQNPLLGVVDPARLVQDLAPGMTARFTVSNGQLSPSVQLGSTTFAPEASPASSAEMLQRITSQPGFAGTTAGLTQGYGALLQGALADVVTLQRNLAKAVPPPTAMDLLPSASRAFEALASRLTSPGEAGGANGQPGPLGRALIFTGGLFDKYAEQQQTQARQDLAIGLTGAVAGLGATILTVASGGAAAPLLIASMAGTSMLAGGYGMFRTHERFVDAQRLARFGELSGVEDPSAFQYLLEQGLNLFGIVMDGADIAQAVRVMRGTTAATEAARMLGSLEQLLASPLGLRLASRLDDGAEVTDATLTALRQLQSGGYTFEQVADIANRAVTAPETLTDAERALNQVVRAERLYTPQALALYQRYHLGQGMSPEDAYRSAVAASGGDATKVPPEVAQDYVQWMQRPSTVDSARNTRMALPPKLAVYESKELIRVGVDPLTVRMETGLGGRPVYTAPNGTRYIYDGSQGMREVPQTFLASTYSVMPAKIKEGSLAAAGLEGLNPENLRVFQAVEGGSVLVDRTTGAFYFQGTDGAVTDFYVHLTPATKYQELIAGKGLQPYGPIQPPDTFVDGQLPTDVEGLTTSKKDPDMLMASWTVSSHDQPDWLVTRNRSNTLLGDVLLGQARRSDTENPALVYIFMQPASTDVLQVKAHTFTEGSMGRASLTREQWYLREPQTAPEVILFNPVSWDRVTMVMSQTGEILYAPPPVP
ncbi:hypothetical protein [Corallococcus exercitus]|uniref:hypothetical protein n=1 Tax=Corallococcus exercitus TaxID=2316736 RepID=UPI0035D43035